MLNEIYKVFSEALLSLYPIFIKKNSREYRLSTFNKIIRLFSNTNFLFFI